MKIFCKRNYSTYHAVFVASFFSFYVFSKKTMQDGKGGDKTDKKDRKEEFKKQPFYRSVIGAFLSWRVFTSSLALLLRLFSGGVVQRPVGKRPVEPLRLYK